MHLWCSILGRARSHVWSYTSLHIRPKPKLLLSLILVHKTLKVANIIVQVTLVRMYKISHQFLINSLLHHLFFQLYVLNTHIRTDHSRVVS